jgi:hypothetical protein
MIPENFKAIIVTKTGSTYFIVFIWNCINPACPSAGVAVVCCIEGEKYICTNWVIPAVSAKIILGFLISVIPRKIVEISIEVLPINAITT